MQKNHRAPFTPALGRPALTQAYDRIIAVMTRERRWRKHMLDVLEPSGTETIVDIGSGTGTFAKMVLESSCDVRFVAVDPDPEIRAIAEAKTAGLTVEFVTAMGDEMISSVPAGTADKVTCSLVLHQCPMAAKIGILTNAYRLLKPGGRLLISDYGEQRTLPMSLLFNQVRLLDGYENTKPNKEGLIPKFIECAGFERVEELYVTPTPTGSIALHSGWKPL